MSNRKFFCPHCLKSEKSESWTCGKHDKNDYMSSTQIRYPSPSSSKPKLKEFISFLKSLWGYENSKDPFWDNERRKIKILEGTLKK